MAFDEYGRPFIILRVSLRVFCNECYPWQAQNYDRVVYAFSCVQEQEKKQRVRGIDAQKSNIQAARAITRILKSSLGPKGMDKMLQGPDGDVCISEHSPCRTQTLQSSGASQTACLCAACRTMT